MKKTIGFLPLVLLCAGTAAHAAETDINATTLLTFQERSIPGYSDKFQPTGYQFLNVNVADNDQRLSLNLYGWGSLDLRSPSRNGDGDLTSGYVKYRFPKANANIKAGRFYEFQMTGIEQIDGISARTDFSKYVGLSVFGGAPVRTDFDNKGDYIYGGKITLKIPKYAELGVSALQEEGASTIRRDDTITNRRQLAGANLFISPHRVIDLQGNASYNLVTDGIMEQRYLLNIRPADQIQINAEFRDYRYEHYFANTSMPWLFDPEPGGKQQSIGGNINLRPVKPFELTLLYRHYRMYGNERKEFDRFGAQTRLFFKSFTTGFHYYRVDSREAEYRYHEGYAFGEFRTEKTTTNLYVSTHVYDEKIYEETLDLRIGGSLGFKLTKALTVTGGVSWGRNPHLKDDVTGSLWLTYNATL